MRVKKTYIHADDLGLSSAINQTIFACYDAGNLDSASVIVNGYAFEEAMETCITKTGLELHLHINLMEGPALSPSPELTDKDGFFSRSFGYLYQQHLTGSIRPGTPLYQSIYREIKAQVEKFIPYAGGKGLYIDSHIHTHAIPSVFDILMELKKEYPVEYIRIPQERWTYSTYNISTVVLRRNFVKQWLLNRLSDLNIKKHHAFLPPLKRNFYGVRYSGIMNKKTIELSRLLYLHSDKDTEVLLHPGQAIPAEMNYWKKYPQLAKYYLSVDRAKERATLLTEEKL